MGTSRGKSLWGFVLFIGLAFLGCAPSTDSGSARGSLSLSSESVSSSEQSGIIGGVDSLSSFQKANGVAGLLVVAFLSDGTVRQSVCTVSVISEKVALTAAHCVEPNEKMVKMAAYLVFDLDMKKALNEFNKDPKSSTQLTRKVVGAIMHEDYENANDSMNDIAVISFVGGVPADFKLSNLPSEEAVKRLLPGAEVTLSGFGVSKYNKDSKSGTVESEGSGLLRQIAGIKVLGLTPSKKEIAVDQRKGVGACHGDSGGPAYLVDQNGKSTLVGITSRGIGSQNCDKLTVYTSVFSYLDWIKTSSQKLEKL